MSSDATVSRLRLAVLRLARRIRQNVGASDLTPSQQSIIVVLDRFGPMSLGELATRESVQPPSITRTVKALQTSGLVHREIPDRRSRRVLVGLTEAGRQTAREVHLRRDAWLAARMDDLRPDEVAALREALPVLERILAEQENHAGRPIGDNDPSTGGQGK